MRYMAISGNFDDGGGKDGILGGGIILRFEP